MDCEDGNVGVRTQGLVLLVHSTVDFNKLPLAYALPNKMPYQAIARIISSSSGHLRPLGLPQIPQTLLRPWSPPLHIYGKQLSTKYSV